MIMYTGKKKTIDAVQRLRLTFPAVIISYTPLPSLLPPFFFFSIGSERVHVYVNKRGEVTCSITESNYGSMMSLA